MRKMRKREGGFTLIELITVIIILGILAAVVAPKYFDMSTKAQTAALNGATSEGIARFNMAYADYIMTNTSAPTTLAQLNLDSTVDIGDFQLDYSLTGTTVTLTTTRETAAGAKSTEAADIATTNFEWPS